MVPVDSLAARFALSCTDHDQPERETIATDLAVRLGVAPNPFAQLGRYCIGDRLGGGGLGVVYRARDPVLARDVAIKVLHAHRSPASEARMLLREARALARLEHPCIVQVFDIGTSEGPTGSRVFVAMELVEGRDLAQWLRHPRSVRAIVDVFVDAASGLEAIHAAGLLHRDVKPGNVLIGRDGRAKVADLGLAVLLCADAEASTLRCNGDQTAPPSWAPAGTPRYMAPEQLAGHSLSPQADQYALCASLFEALYGCPPHVANSLLALKEAKQAGPEIPRRPYVPAPLVDIMRRGLDPIPERRFATTADLAQALRRSLRPGSSRRALVVSVVAAAFAAVTPARAGPENGAVTSMTETSADDEGRAARVQDLARARVALADGDGEGSRGPSTAAYFDAVANADPRTASAAATTMVGASAILWDARSAAQWARFARTHWVHDEKADDLRELRLAHNLATAYLTSGALPNALDTIEAAVTQAESTGVLGPALADARQLYAEVLLHHGRPAEAAAVHARLRTDAINRSEPERVVHQLGWANVLLSLHNLDAACPAYADAHASSVRDLGPEHPTTASICINHAICLGEQGQGAAAVEQFEPCQDTLRAALGPEHSALALVSGIRGRLELAAGDPRALETLRAAARDLEARLGPNHFATIDALHFVGIASVRAGEVAAAEQQLSEALQRRIEGLPEGHVDIYETYAQRSVARRIAGDDSGAQSDLRTAVAGFRARRLHAHYIAEWTRLQHEPNEEELP